MRLISQTGDIDIPYENASLSRAENIIRAYIPETGEKEQLWLFTQQKNRRKKQ